MKTSLEKRVLDFFGKMSNQEIELNSTVNNDLGIIGDDVDFMILSFTKEFGTDFSSFNAKKYFLPELMWRYWYYRLFYPEKLVKPPVTISHMVQVAKKGVWFEPN